MRRPLTTSDQLLQLKLKEQRLEEKLKQKLKTIGDADHPMESRYQTGRFDLENEIELLKIRLNQIQTEIYKLEKDL